VDGELSRTVLTETDGEFTADLPAEREGDLQLVARFESDSPGRPSVTSSRVTVRVVASPPLASLLFVFAIVVCLIIALTLRRRSGMVLQVPIDETAPVSSVRQGALTTRSASLHGVDGRVRDCSTDSPIAGASFALRRGESIIMTTSSDGQGTFSFSELEQGPLVLEVRRKGYRDFRVSVTIPHRGEWSGAEVRLESLRQIALAPLRRLARRLLARERTWGIWTNREITHERIEAMLGADNAHELVQRVDDAYYGNEGPSEADIREIEGLAEAGMPASDQLD